MKFQKDYTMRFLKILDTDLIDIFYNMNQELMACCQYSREIEDREAFKGATFAQDMLFKVKEQILGCMEEVNNDESYGSE